MKISFIFSSHIELISVEQKCVHSRSSQKNTQIKVLCVEQSMTRCVIVTSCTSIPKRLKNRNASQNFFFQAPFVIIFIWVNQKPLLGYIPCISYNAKDLPSMLRDTLLSLIFHLQYHFIANSKYKSGRFLNRFITSNITLPGDV